MSFCLSVHLSRCGVFYLARSLDLSVPVLPVFISGLGFQLCHTTLIFLLFILLFVRVCVLFIWSGILVIPKSLWFGMEAVGFSCENLCGLLITSR